MMSIRKFVKDDTLVSLYAILEDAEGNVVDLSGHTVTFVMEAAATGVNKVDNKPAAIVSAAAGTVRYDWDPLDVDTEGKFYGWFVRTSGGKTAHHPIGKDLAIWICRKP